MPAMLGRTKRNGGAPLLSKGSSPLARLQHLWAVERSDPAVYRLLVASLFSSPASIVPGGIAGILTPLLCWNATGRDTFIEITILTAAVVLMRLCTVVGYSREDNREHTFEDTRRWDREFFVGATVFSLILGINCLLALSTTDNAAAHLTAVAGTIAFSSGYVARNAGRPIFVTLQLLCFCVPLAIGLLWSD